MTDSSCSCQPALLVLLGWLFLLLPASSSCALRLALLALASRSSYYCRFTLVAPARQPNYCPCRLVLLALASQPFLFLYIGWLFLLLPASPSCSCRYALLALVSQPYLVLYSIGRFVGQFRGQKIFFPSNYPSKCPIMYLALKKITTI